MPCPLIYLIHFSQIACKMFDDVNVNLFSLKATANRKKCTLIQNINFQEVEKEIYQVVIAQYFVKFG